MFKKLYKWFTSLFKRKKKVETVGERIITYRKDGSIFEINHKGRVKQF